MNSSDIKSLRPLLPVLLLLLPAAAQAIRVEPGQWELHMQRSTPGSARVTETTLTQCFTEGEYDPATVVRFLAGNCELRELSAQGDTVTWSMECAGTGPGGSNVSGDGIFIADGDIARGEIIMRAAWRGRTLRMDSSLNGRRIGTDCQ